MDASLEPPPLDAQAYNRYAYVHNRPLIATDPTGYGKEDIGRDDGGSEGNPENLGRHCIDGKDCFRYLDVSGNPTSSYDAWSDALYFFDLTNGPGQRGPRFNGGNPYSPNGHRHGNDHGQPGGSPAFTIHVTPDMCAQIAACSGVLPKRGPSRIWHAPIDDYAETAADLVTDLLPGVAQAKTAYDAYERIQNGEDPVDVLMAAGGDAALGLIPGLRTGKKVAKALDKTEDVADAAGDVSDAAKRAGELHGLLDPRAQRSRTTAVTDTAEGVRIVSSSERRLSPAQRRALRPGEVEGVGVGHAEVTGVEAARRLGLTPVSTAASRPICDRCMDAMQATGVRPDSPTKR